MDKIIIFIGAVTNCAHSNVELCNYVECYESGDAEVYMTMNNEELYHISFKEKEVIWNDRVPSYFHTNLAYEIALFTRSNCEHEIYRYKLEKASFPQTTDAPETAIYPRDKVVMGVKNTLICFISNFYPPAVKVKWTMNDAELPADRSSNLRLPNHDGTFYMFSRLQFTPKHEDIYACTVEHEALEYPQSRFWEPETKASISGPDVFCGVGLSLGLVGVAVGTFIFVKVNNGS